jgi:phosphatidylserine decarboxylase
MSQSLEEWLVEIEPFKRMDPDVLSSVFFFRDPSRPIFLDSDYIFSPADGTIIDQGFIKPDQQIVEMKGVDYSPRKLLEEPAFNSTSLCISIFMSQYDVHINRMPTNGNVFFRTVDPIQTKNIPMIFEERDLLAGHSNYEHMDYVTANARTINRITNGGYQYYLVQICDTDVNVVAPFSTKQGKHFFQNERFSVVRYGSQVTLVLPLTDSFDFDLMEQPERHVRAGLDRLVYLRSKKRD